MSFDKWSSETESPKGWMSVRDADLYETLLHRISTRHADRPLRVVEWGAGRSTLWYTGFLDSLKVPYSWLALDHDGNYFRTEIAGELGKRPRAIVLRGEETTSASVRQALLDGGIVAVTFDAGELWPFCEGHELDRAVDLDSYVELPGRLGLNYDLAVVDGRKRRRCLLEAARLLSPRGYAILHDAWRQPYKCAWSAYASSRRFGDEWWIGSQEVSDFLDLLPRHAFERHRYVDEQPTPQG